MPPFAEAAPDFNTLGMVVVSLVFLARAALDLKQLFGGGPQFAPKADLARLEAKVDKNAAESRRAQHDLGAAAAANNQKVLERVEVVHRAVERLAARLGD